MINGSKLLLKEGRLNLSFHVITWKNGLHRNALLLFVLLLDQQRLRKETQLKPVSEPELYDDGDDCSDSSFEDEYDNTSKPKDQEQMEMKNLNKVKQQNENVTQRAEAHGSHPHPSCVPVFIRTSSKDADDYNIMAYDPQGQALAAAQDKGDYSYVPIEQNFQHLSSAVDHDNNEKTFATHGKTCANKFLRQDHDTVKIRKAKLKEIRRETKFASKVKVYLGVFLEYRKVERTYVLIIHVVLTCDFMELKSTNGTKLFAYKPFLVYEDRGDPVIHVESLQWEPYSVNYKEEPNTAQLDNLWQGLPCEIKFIRQFKSRWFLPVVPKIVKFDISVVQQDTPKTTLNVFAEKKEMKAEKYGKNWDVRRTDAGIPLFPELVQQQNSEYGIRDIHSHYSQYGGRETQSPTTDQWVSSSPLPPEMRQSQKNGALYLDQHTLVPDSAQQREELYHTPPETDPHYAILIRRTPPIPASPPPSIPPSRPLVPRRVSSPDFPAQPLNYVNFPVLPWKRRIDS